MPHSALPDTHRTRLQTVNATLGTARVSQGYALLYMYEAVNLIEVEITDYCRSEHDALLLKYSQFRQVVLEVPANGGQTRHNSSPTSGHVT